jgi:Zn-dependent M28 family amino/carboxypeptidase
VKRKALASAVLCIAVAIAPAAAGATHTKEDDSAKLRRAVNSAGILVHEAALQAIGLVKNGNRLAGAPGQEASAQYVAAVAKAAGLNVSSQSFDYDLDFLADYKQPVLTVVTPGKRRAFVPGIAGAIPGGDFGSQYGSPSTDITAKVWAVDLNLPAPANTPNSNTSACQPDDFLGMPPGSIALIQRGTCPFVDKWTNALAAGAGAVVMFNEGNSGVPGRTEPLWFDLPSFGVPTPPMTSATIGTAIALANGVQKGDTGLRARFRIDWRPGTYPTKNVIAETRGGDPNSVIVVGAHLDSVGTGPGINDNGSGSAGILAIAKELDKFKLQHKVRFIWFSAEESGLLGSEAYVASLPPEERAKIKAMLNFDMIGSPNFVRFVYDGDLSDSPPPPGGAPAGSAEIEALFLEYFASQGLATEPTPFDGRSDYGPFIAAGIPAGGLFTGAEGIKTPAEAAVYGGTAGEQYDPCYHLGCDNITNLSRTALDQMADAAAHVTITLAQRPGDPLPSAGAPVQARTGARAASGFDLPTPRAAGGS